MAAGHIVLAPAQNRIGNIADSVSKRAGSGKIGRKGIGFKSVFQVTASAPGIWHPAPAPCTVHPAPGTLHPAPCTLHPALGTVHRAPCTVHPARGTRHPAPGTQHR